MIINFQRAKHDKQRAKGKRYRLHFSAGRNCACLTQSEVGLSCGRQCQYKSLIRQSYVKVRTKLKAVTLQGHGKTFYEIGCACRSTQGPDEGNRGPDHCIILRLIHGPSRAGLLRFAGRIWPAGRTLPTPAFVGNSSTLDYCAVSCRVI